MRDQESVKGDAWGLPDADYISIKEEVRLLIEEWSNSGKTPTPPTQNDGTRGDARNGASIAPPLRDKPTMNKGKGDKRCR
jgi:hypothetical protein